MIRRLHRKTPDTSKTGQSQSRKITNSLAFLTLAFLATVVLATTHAAAPPERHETKRNGNLAMTSHQSVSPPVKTFKNCTDLRAAGWARGVTRSGGTYDSSWNKAEKQTYTLNAKKDRDKDGHACET